MIYLDNAATTKMYEKGADIYKIYACQSFFNPSANYKEALKIDEELMQVRKHLLLKLGARQGNIIFTSGATESNNLAIMGSKRNGKWEYVFSEGEHPSVYNVAKELSMQGYVVHFVKLQKNGEIDYSQLESVLNQNTRLISVMQPNILQQDYLFHQKATTSPFQQNPKAIHPDILLFYKIYRIFYLILYQYEFQLQDYTNQQLNYYFFLI